MNCKIISKCSVIKRNNNKVPFCNGVVLICKKEDSIFMLSSFCYILGKLSEIPSI